jgi:hypothetical protein
MLSEIWTTFFIRRKIKRAFSQYKLWPNHYMSSTWLHGRLQFKEPYSFTRQSFIIFWKLHGFTSGSTVILLTKDQQLLPSNPFTKGICCWPSIATVTSGDRTRIKWEQCAYIRPCHLFSLYRPMHADVAWRLLVMFRASMINYCCQFSRNLVDPDQFWT